MGMSPRRYERRSKIQETPMHQALTATFNHSLVCPCSRSAGIMTCSRTNSKLSSWACSLSSRNKVQNPPMNMNQCKTTHVVKTKVYGKNFGKIRLINRIGSQTTKITVVPNIIIENRNLLTWRRIGKCII